MQYGFLRAGKHQSIVHNARPGLDVVHLMAGESPPGRYTENKAGPCPVIDAHRAVTQVRNRPLHRRGYCRVLERTGMNDNRSVERAPYVLVAKCHGPVDVFRNASRFQSRLGKQAAERPLL